MNHKYKGNTPVTEGDRVELMLDDDVTVLGRVIETLASQMIVRVPRTPKHEVHFAFYADKGVTWKPIN